MRQTEIHICIRGFRIRGRKIFNGRILFLHNNLAGFCHLILALLIIVIQLDRTQWKLIKIVQKHQNNFRRIGTAAPGDHNGKFFHHH